MVQRKGKGAKSKAFDHEFQSLIRGVVGLFRHKKLNKQAEYLKNTFGIGQDIQPSQNLEHAWQQYLDARATSMKLPAFQTQSTPTDDSQPGPSGMQHNAVVHVNTSIVSTIEASSSLSVDIDATPPTPTDDQQTANAKSPYQPGSNMLRTTLPGSKSPSMSTDTSTEDNVISSSMGSNLIAMRHMSKLSSPHLAPGVAQRTRSALKIYSEETTGSDITFVNSSGEDPPGDLSGSQEQNVVERPRLIPSSEVPLKSGVALRYVYNRNKITTDRGVAPLAEIESFGSVSPLSENQTFGSATIGVARGDSHRPQEEISSLSMDIPAHNTIRRNDFGGTSGMHMSHMPSDSYFDALDLTSDEGANQPAKMTRKEQNQADRDHKKLDDEGQTTVDKITVVEKQIIQVKTMYRCPHPNCPFESESPRGVNCHIGRTRNHDHTLRVCIKCLKVCGGTGSLLQHRITSGH